MRSRSALWGCSPHRELPVCEVYMELIQALGASGFRSIFHYHSTLVIDASVYVRSYVAASWILLGRLCTHNLYSTKPTSYSGRVVDFCFILDCMIVAWLLELASLWLVCNAYMFTVTMDHESTTHIESTTPVPGQMEKNHVKPRHILHSTRRPYPYSG